MLVRLENCDIVGPFQSVFYQWNRAAQVFSSCRFSRPAEESKSSIERAGDMVEFTGCSFEYTASGELPYPTFPKRRSLAELNPAWSEFDPR